MRRLAAALVTLAALLALALSACSDREQSRGPSSTDTTAASSATRPPSTPEPLTPGLRKILEDVASVRELPAPPELEVNLIPRSELPALLESLLTNEDKEWFRNTTTLYRLLGHLRKDQDYQSVYQSFGSQSVLGLYSPLDDALWVVHDDGDNLDLNNLPAAHKMTLAHEFVHAVQDYNFQLDKIYSDTVDDLDRGLTYTSAVEGDAVATERAYTRKFGMRIGAGPVLLAAGDPASMQDVPPSIARELFFPYTTGVEWIVSLRQSGGTDAVNGVIKDPPRGTTYVLHPELLANGFKPSEVKLPDLSGALGNGWAKQSGGQFGEFQVRNYLQLQLRGSDAAAAAQGWQGDRYDVYVNGDQSVASFRLRFASDNEASEFEQAQRDWMDDADAQAEQKDGATFYAAGNGNVTAVAPRNGSEIVFVIGSNRDVAAKALAALLKG